MYMYVHAHRLWSSFRLRLGQVPIVADVPVGKVLARGLLSAALLHAEGGKVAILDGALERESKPSRRSKSFEWRSRARASASVTAIAIASASAIASAIAIAIAIAIASAIASAITIAIAIAIAPLSTLPPRPGCTTFCPRRPRRLHRRRRCPPRCPVLLSLRRCHPEARLHLVRRHRCPLRGRPI